MTLALKSPELVQDIVAVDNAPVDAVLESSFSKYIQGLKRIEAANITKQAEADEILKDYEDVRLFHFTLRWVARPISINHAHNDAAVSPNSPVSSG